MTEARLAIVETKVKQHDISLENAWDAIDSIKDRLFNVLLAVSGSCIVATGAMAFYLITAPH